MQNQNKPRNPTEGAIRDNLILLIDQEDADSIIQQVKLNPLAFDVAIALIKDLITTDYSEKEFIISLFLSLVKSFGIPVALALETDEFCSFFDLCYTAEKIIEVLILLKECLSLFNFVDQMIIIPQLSSLFQKHADNETLVRNEKLNNEFFELYKSIQQIVNFQQTNTETEEKKNILYHTLKTLFSKGSLERSSFNSLENHLLRRYQNDLKQTFDLLTSEREEIQKFKKVQEALKFLPKEKQLKNRVIFIQGENILFEESEENEYKDYSFPFNDPLERTLSKTICSFLNQKGGRIYIGINDQRIVKGIKLLNNQKEELKLTLVACIRNFEPNIIEQNLVKVYFIPICDGRTGETISDLYIVKIIVNPGDPKELYSVSKDILQCYVRYSDQSKLLSALQTKEAIRERMLLTEEQSSVISDFEDPEPQIQITNNITQQKKQEEKNKLENILGGDLNCNLSAIEPVHSDERMLSFLRDFQSEASLRLHNLKSVSGMSLFNESEFSKHLDMSGLEVETKAKIEQTHKNKIILSEVSEESKTDINWAHSTGDPNESRTHQSDMEISSSLKIFPEDKPMENSLDSTSINDTKISSKSSGYSRKEELLQRKQEAYKPNSSLSKSGTANNSKTDKHSYDSNKKKNSKQEQKEYFSNMVENVTSLQIGGSNLLQVFEIFIEGLPTTWTQESFQKFIDEFNFTSLFSSRMFKKDTGHCNGKAFLNFTNKEEATHFIESCNGSVKFGKEIKAKFK